MLRRLTVLFAVGLFALSGAGAALAGIQNDSLEADFGFRVALQFAHNNLSAGDGGSPTIPIAGTRDTSAASQANTEYAMPFSGRILGIGAVSNTALTTGAAHFIVTVNSVEVANTGVALSASGSTTSNTRSLVDRFTKSSPYTFSAGDRIGVAMNTSPPATIGPDTADIVVTVIVDQNALD